MRLWGKPPDVHSSARAGKWAHFKANYTLRAHIRTLNTSWVYVWEQTVGVPARSECFLKMMEEAPAGDPYRCKLSAVVNKSEADIISALC